MLNLAFILCFNFAIGIIVSLLFVRRQDLESRFFRTNGIIATIFMLVAFFIGREKYFVSYELLIMVVLLIAYSVNVFWLPVFVERLMLWVVAIGGGFILWHTLPLLDSTAIWRKADFGTLLVGGILMGMCLVAMNVGHSYLSSVKLSMRPLRTTTLAIGSMLIFRLVLISIFIPVLVKTVPQAATEVSKLFELQNVTLLAIALVRVLFGVLGPLVLFYMTWETVKIKSNQSATGILYALLALVLVGEASAFYLTLTTSLPI